MQYKVNMICPAITLDHNYVDEHNDEPIIIVDNFDDAVQYCSDYRNTVNRHQPILYVIPVDNEYNILSLEHCLSLPPYNKEYNKFKDEMNSYYE